MSAIQSFAKELEAESKTTRKMFERVPDEKFSWKPHEKSMTLSQLVTHIAELPTWLKMILDTEELDFAKSRYKPALLTGRTALLEFFEQSLVVGKTALDEASPSQLGENWSMRNGAQVFFTRPKEEMIRSVFCQVVHHRAQLGVYLRLLDIPIPGSYGPSADEQG